MIIGRVLDLFESYPKVILFDWEHPEIFEQAVVESDGQWESPSPVEEGHQYGIYYLSQNENCPPICHGPYIAE